MKRYILGTLLTLCPLAALANDSPQTGFYLGAALGSNNLSVDDEDPWGEHYDTGFSSSGTTTKLFAGYMFNRIVGVELEYSAYGKSYLDGVDYQVSPDTLALQANLGYSFDNGLRPYGRVGFTRVDLAQSGTVRAADGNTHGALRIGFGLEYQPLALKGFGFRFAYDVDAMLELDAYDAEENDHDYYNVDLSSFNVGAFYRF